MEREIGLSDEELQKLRAEGYLLVRDFLSKAFCEDCVAELERWSRGQHDLAAAEFRYRGWHQSFASSVADSDAIRRLRRLAASLTVEPLCPDPKVQFACRLPGERAQKQRIDPHIDGRDHAEDPDPSRIENFAVNIGTFLSDTPCTDFGNLVVWPRSHVSYANYFRKFGAKRFLMQPYVRVDGAPIGFRSMPEVSLQEPTQIAGLAGDVVILNWHLGHAYVGNRKSSVRHMMYSRFYWASQSSKQRCKRLADPWSGWK